MSSGTSLPALPRYTEIQTDLVDPYMIRVIVPFDTGTVDEAVAVVQGRIDDLLSSQTFRDAVMDALRISAADLPDQNAGDPVNVGDLYLANELLGIKKAP